MNLEFLWMILISLFGFNNNGQVNDLRKKPTREDYKKEFNLWIGRNFNFIALAAIIFLLIFFVGFCFWVGGFSATDSGMYYNRFDKVV